MSAQGLTSEAQLRYLLQWFGEFSELQKEDFLPVLAAAKGDGPSLLAATRATQTSADKPLKLFNEWYPTWTEDHQDRLIKGISEIDTDYGKKLQELIENGPQLNENEPQFDVENGQNGTGESPSPTYEEVESGKLEDEEPNVVEPVEPAIIQEAAPVDIAAAT